MKYLIFITTIIFSCFISYAEFTYFDFELTNYFMEENKEINVDIKYLLNGYEEKDFKIRPIVLNGIVEILNKENNEWVSSYGFINKLPTLKDNFLIRIKGLSLEKTELFFEIKNINTNQIYLTPKKYIWSKKVYENYLEDIKIYKDEKTSEEIIKNDVLESSSSKNIDEIDKNDNKITNLEQKIDKIPKIFFLILGIMSFILSFAVGYVGYMKIINYISRKKRMIVNGKIH